MGLFTRRKAIVASADPVTIDTNGTGKRRGSNEQQARAWVHYDRVPEMWFGHNYIANALKRIRIFPAIQPDPPQPPIPLGPTDGAIGARANAEMDRLRDEDGSHGTFIHDAALQLAIPGEGLFANYDDVETGLEIFGIYSIDELQMRDGRWFLKDNETTNAGEELPEDTLVNRFWRPHPRFRKRPDSAFFALRDTLDELMLLDRLYRSNARSQVPNGIWLMPEEAQLRDRARPNRRPNQQPGQQGKTDPLIDAFLAYFQQTLSEEDSAGNVAPGVLKVKGDLIEQFKEFSFGRQFDAQTAARYDRVLKRAADGVDMPASIITGMEDLNHWTAWQVDEDAFDSHLAPLVELICAACTKVFLRPALADVQEAGQEKVITWYDASALMSHPNKSSDADGAYDRFAISAATYRKVKGYGEDDAPDEEEMAKRIEISKEIRGAIPGGAVGTSQPGAPQGARTITASVGPINELGLELARLDRDLRVQLQAVCEGAVIRALEKAGAKMRRKVQGVDALKAQIEGVTNARVCLVLGSDVVRRYFATDDELIDDAVVPIIPAYTRLVSRVQRLVRSTASEYGDLPDNVEAKQDADRQRGAEILTTSIGAVIASMLYSPAVTAPARGEIDDTFTVPAGVLRDALAAAGGAPTSSAVNQLTDAPEGGVATGTTSMDIFVRIGLTPDGWAWVYGDAGSRKAPFAGHFDLDGVEFLDWHDEALRVTDDDAWLNRDYYAPGDHLYCQCDFAPVMKDDTTNDDQLEPAISEA